MNPQNPTTTELETTAQAAPTLSERAAAITPRMKGDRSLWGIYLLLIIVSLVELYSASSQEVSAESSFGVYSPIIRHGVQLFLGFLIILFIQSRSYVNFILWGPLIAIGSFLMMLAVLKYGEDINGAKRSLDLYFITVYPSEFIKLSAAIMIALIMAWTHSKKNNEKLKNLGVWLSAGVAVIFGGVLFTQGLTNTILLMGISFAMMIIGGVGFKQLVKVLCVYLLVALFLGGIGIIWSKSTAPAKTEQTGQAALTDDDDEQTKSEAGLFDRFETWIARLERFAQKDSIPKYEQRVTDKNRQEMYGYMAQAHGGLTGVLPGNSRETARLPLAFSDYIYSIIVEEWGLAGGVFVMILYLWLLARASSIASRCNQRFAALLVIGMAVMIVLQALFHMAIVTGVFPVSGQPLPLISKGGTSILVTSIAFGIMLSVSRFGLKTERRQDASEESELLPESMRSENPNMLV
ncbi:MAG: FtsW/RodA/SpoVE family cell cycle protein [Clostridium sp.]|nr:FtsW/RodA/SpoVE family cell cycle protein [Clostridium sp.]